MQHGSGHGTRRYHPCSSRLCRKERQSLNIRHDAENKNRIEKNALTLENILADTGYSSGQNYHHLEKENITAYIPTNGVYKHERQGFTYHKEGDYFLCSNNKKLLHKKTYTNAAGSLMKCYRSTRNDCRECPFKKTCLGQKAQEKKFELSYFQEEYERAYKRQQTNYFKRTCRQAGRW